MADELLSCPFCGGDALLRKWKDESLWNHNIVDWTEVGCGSCDVSVHSCDGVSDDDTAEAKWNRRAAPASSAATVEPNEVHDVLQGLAGLCIAHRHHTDLRNAMDLIVKLQAALAPAGFVAVPVDDAERLPDTDAQEIARLAIDFIVACPEGADNNCYQDASATHAEFDALAEAVCRD